MMKRRGFFLNSTVILLLIPLLLLLATYEDVSSQVVQAQGVRIQAERTYRIISYLELDFQKALEISGKRAVIAVVDYVSVTGNFIFPAYMVNNTIRDLILEGNSPSLAGYDPNRVMRGQSLRNWFTNITEDLNKQGFRVFPTVDDILDDTNITVAPLDSFRIVIKARIPNVTIRDASGRVVYTGPIPSNGGYVYSIVDLQNLEDPLFSAMTGGRYYRSIKACKYAFPKILERPIKVLYGNGNSDRDHVVGIYNSSPNPNHIFFGSTYPNADAYAYVLKSGSPLDDTPFLNGTVLRPGGDIVDPTSVIKDNDLGVLVFDNTSVSNWCDVSYKWRVNITIPQTPWGSLVLLKVPTSMFPGIYFTENNASLVIYSGDGSCNQVNFWIEYWGNTYAWIWIKSTGTSYSIYFTDDPNKATSGYNADRMFWLIDTFDGSAGSSPNPSLWKNPGEAYLDGNGNLVVPAGVKKLVLQTLDALTGKFFVRFRMVPERTLEDFDAGVQVASLMDFHKGYLQVTVNYPSNVQDVQIPVYLNSSIAQMILHNDLSQAQIEVYSDPQMTSSLPFWIEYWNDNGALIWIRGDLPGTFYIKYNTGTYRRGDGDAVFSFFDDFNETLSKWIVDPYNQGAKASIDTTGNGTVTIDGGDSIFAMSTVIRLNITYKFAVRFRMKPNFEMQEDWDAGIGLIDQYVEVSDIFDPLLFTDDITWEYLAQHRAWWGHKTWSTSDREDYTFHTYEVSMYNYDYSYDYGNFIFEDITATGRTPTIGRWFFRYPLNRICLVIDSEDEDRGATYDWIFVRKLIDDDELSYNITIHPTIYDLQFIDDTSATNEDHGGDFLGILKNWENSMVSIPNAPFYSSYVYRYEVKFTPSNGNVGLSFARISSTGSIDRVETSVSGYSTDSLKVGIVIDNNRDNNAYFDWIIIGLGSYHFVNPTQIIGSSVETAPEITVTYTARAYDLQPFIDCIMDQRYFGIENGWSFFERLEGGSKNHDRYVKLAHEIQNELGLESYPIGLVSFMIPYFSYDEKLFNLFNALGIPVEEGQSSVDYHFLNYSFKNRPKTTGFRVWGVSYGIIPEGDLSSIPFFIDEPTAEAIFGFQGSQDLLKR